jgi:alpha-ketoglutarate-dependent taurine dioxygenase
MDAFRELTLRAQSSTEVHVAEVIEACRNARLVLVHADAEGGRRRAFWDGLLSASQFERVAVDEDVSTGEPIDRLWSNIEFDPQQAHRFRHSSSAQPLHTDGAYVLGSPPYVLMFCERAARAGGATLFIDGSDLVCLLEAQHASLLSVLRTEPVVFRKGRREVESTVISEAVDGPVLRWNYYALAEGLAPRTRAIAEQFQSFLLGITRRSIPRAIRLEEGDAVFFRDDLLLHGRESFSADAAGDRRLWKGGLRA